MDRQTEGQTYSSNYNIDIKGRGKMDNIHFWPNLSENSFVKSILFFSFQICAYIWYRVKGLDLYLDVTDS